MTQRIEPRSSVDAALLNDAAVDAARGTPDAPTDDEDLRESVASFTADLSLDPDAKRAPEPAGGDVTAAATATAPDPVTLTSVGVGTVVYGIPYTADGKTDDKQRLDVYFPGGLDKDAEFEAAKKRPLVIHVHGGGWVRGDRSITFYGAPPMANAYAGMGFVAVAPSYRLGQYPLFIVDVVDAILFATGGALEHAVAAAPSSSGVKPRQLEVLRAQVANGVVLSGHSAGAHIVSTITTVGHRLACLGDRPAVVSRLKDLLVPGRLRAVLLLSGIYSLRNPFSDCGPCNWKNSVFGKMYIQRAFKPFDADLDELSPAWHVAKFIRAGSAAVDTFCKSTGVPAASMPHGAEDLLADPPLVSIPCAIFSASCDLGLEDDSRRFRDLLVAARQYAAARHRRAATTDASPDAARVAPTMAGEAFVEWTVVPKTSHPSICQRLEAHKAFAEALRRMLNAADLRNGSS